MRRTSQLSAPLALMTLAAALSGCAWGGQGDRQDVRPPAAPRGLTVQAGSATTAHVMWNQATDDTEVTGYVVYRDAKKVKEVPGRRHMVDVTGLKPSTSYAFTVRARDAEGNLSEDSRRLTVTTPAAAAADHRPPTRPARLRGEAEGSRSAMLSWGKSTDDRAVASYEIYQGASKIHSVGGGQTATLVTGLRPGTDYTFTVKARDAADNFSPASPAVRLTTAAGKDSGRGTAPAGFRATTHRADGAYYIDLTWTPPRTGGAVTEYQIQLDGRTATSLVFGGTPPKDRAEHSFYIGRKAGERHRVRIRPKLPDGTWGAYSPTRTVTTG
ncbi:fibronectin type III domain-containing protein [Streptomyces huasconensis]|nr:MULTISPECIES: fibronectin type III domain-containing protein [Streptomyces]UFQ14216.1 fibronectin type III domain-containing protein [Streptomyces huasconensis]WCL83815.1 fibronectin type III domain-containing protein [Streptomyces sp. JCM 35825]